MRYIFGALEISEMSGNVITNTIFCKKKEYILPYMKSLKILLLLESWATILQLLIQRL